MQVMPETAKYVARKIGLVSFNPREVNDIGTNIQLGTNYLNMVLKDLDGSQALATAAYNAGPGRPRAWRSTLTRPVEGAIFAETIPFTETRGYVKNVLSNATYYAALFEGKPQSLKARLGVIAPKSQQ
jgi:soluble lytic murein transglycosylase